MSRMIMLFGLLALTSCETLVTSRCVWPGSGSTEVIHYVAGSVLDGDAQGAEVARGD